MRKLIIPAARIKSIPPYSRQRAIYQLIAVLICLWSIIALRYLLSDHPAIHPHLTGIYQDLPQNSQVAGLELLTPTAKQG